MLIASFSKKEKEAYLLIILKLRFQEEGLFYLNENNTTNL